jgi:hypothetical protein
MPQCIGSSGDIIVTYATIYIGFPGDTNVSTVTPSRGSAGESNVHYATMYMVCRRQLPPMPQCIGSAGDIIVPCATIYIGFPGDTNVSTVTPSRGSAGESSVHYATTYMVCRRQLSPMPQCIGSAVDTDVSTATPIKSSVGDSIVHCVAMYKICRRHKPVSVMTK